MDPASAAAMSDPKMNRWFHRRWAESQQAIVEAPTPVAQHIPLKRLGRELLAEWRRGRVEQGSAIL